MEYGLISPFQCPFFQYISNIPSIFSMQCHNQVLHLFPVSPLCCLQCSIYGFPLYACIRPVKLSVPTMWSFDIVSIHYPSKGSTKVYLSTSFFGLNLFWFLFFWVYVLYPSALVLHCKNHHKWHFICWSISLCKRSMHRSIVSIHSPLLKKSFYTNHKSYLVTVTVLHCCADIACIDHIWKEI